VSSWKTRISAIFHPTPSVGQIDTSLLYPDILFGFVIRELFLRLQNWLAIPNVVRAHLIVGTILVVGSWIGFRRSLNRSSYEVKFFNLPFFRFVADQGMLILYFRIATLTPVGTSVMQPNVIANQTLLPVLWVFVLYAVWDILGLREAYSRTEHGQPRYWLVSDKKSTDKQQPANWAGFAITVGFLGALFAEWLVSACLDPCWALCVLAGLLLLYRWIKEIRTTWKSVLKNEPAK
jgi:hypothetical protein